MQPSLSEYTGGTMSRSSSDAELEDGLGRERSALAGAEAPAYLTLREGAARVGRCEKTLRRMIKANRVRARRRDTESEPLYVEVSSLLRAFRDDAEVDGDTAEGEGPLLVTPPRPSTRHPETGPPYGHRAGFPVAPRVSVPDAPRLRVVGRESAADEQDRDGAPGEPVSQPAAPGVVPRAATGTARASEPEARGRAQASLTDERTWLRDRVDRLERKLDERTDELMRARLAAARPQRSGLAGWIVSGLLAALLLLAL